MSEDTTIPLPNGWYGRPIQDQPAWVDLCGPNGEYVGPIKRDYAQKFAAAMNAAQATVPPFRGDGALVELFEALDTWSCERGIEQKDWAHNRLLGAYFSAFPGQLHFRERCTCEPAQDRADCDECMSEAEARAWLRSLRHEGKLPEQAPTTHPGAAVQPVSGSGGVPAGWRLMPIDAHKMGHDAATAFQRAFTAHLEHHGFYESFAVGWKALLAAAPTPPTTASSGAVVAVSVEEVERLKGNVAFWQGLAQQNAEFADKARSELAAQQDKDGVREVAVQLSGISGQLDQAFNKGLEEAALWHESHIQGGHCGEASDEMMVRQRIERHHRNSAAAIRSLKTAATADQPGREGEGSDGWRPIKTAPEGIPVRIRSRRFGWYATAKLVRYCDDEDASRFPATSWDILHYNGDALFRGFYGTGDMEWAPSPAPRQDGEPEVVA